MLVSTVSGTTMSRISGLSLLDVVGLCSPHVFHPPDGADRPDGALLIHFCVGTVASLGR